MYQTQSPHNPPQATFLELYNEEITDLLSTDDEQMLSRDPKAKGLLLMARGGRSFPRTASQSRRAPRLHSVS